MTQRLPGFAQRAVGFPEVKVDQSPFQRLASRFSIPI